MTDITARFAGIGPSAGGTLGVPWRLWALIATAAALVIGIVLYPDIHDATMPISLALLVIGAVLGAIILRGRVRFALLLPLVAAFLPSQQVGFAAYLLALALLAGLFGARRLARPLDTVDGLLLAVLGWAVMSWLANLGTETDLWSFPVFALTFLTPWLLLGLARAVAWTPRDLNVILGAWVALGTSQLVTALVKPIVLGTPESYAVPLLLLQAARLAILQAITAGHVADLTFGTMPSAHHLGVATLLLTVFLVGLFVVAGGTRLLVLAAIAFFVFLMTDSKHVLLAALLPAVLFIATVIWPRLTPDWQRRLGSAAVVVGIAVVAVLGARIANLVVTGLWQPYVSLATINPKVQLVLRTSERMAEGGLHTWIGHGPGSFASRAATIRASDVLYKEESRLPGLIPPHTGESYRSIAYDLYTTEIALTTGFRSGALTNPFSSLVGIVAEFGVLGSLLVALFLWTLTRRMLATWRDDRLPATWRAAAAAAAFGIPLLVLLGIFDSYFEQPDVTAVLLPLMLVGLVGREAVERGGGG